MPSPAAKEKGVSGVERGRPQRPKLTLTYIGLILFVVVYFARPEDWIVAIQDWHVAKLAGGIPIIAFGIAVLGGAKVRLPRAAIVMLLLFGYLAAGIPTSAWRGGSFGLVFFMFSKVTVITLVSMTAVNSLRRLRGALLAQTLCMLGLLGLALLQIGQKPRLYGQGQYFNDPNEMALNLCIVLPFCLAFFLTARNVIKKVIWLAAIALLSYAVMATYSRGGLLAFIAGVGACAVYFGFKPRRPQFVIAALLLLVMGFLVGSPRNYLERVETIIQNDLDTTGSAQARKTILRRSIDVTLRHPFFGVGTDQFAEVAGHWAPTHNTYTQFSAEAGIPALGLFITLIAMAFSSLRKLEKGTPKGSDHWVFAGCVKASLTSYAIGALFLTTSYVFYPFLLIGYATAAGDLTPEPEDGARQDTRRLPRWNWSELVTSGEQGL